MSKKKNNEVNFGDLLEKFYYFLKSNLGFDDIQTSVFIISIILLPISIYLGLFNEKLEILRNMFYITLVIDILVILYSIIKIKYYKNVRVESTKALENIIIEVKDTDDVDKLNPIEFEYFVKEIFVHKGYKAWTTRATHDNGADVVAEKNNERVAIQVKHSTKTIGGYCVYQAVRGKSNYKAEKAILVTNNELTNQAKLDAIRDGVEYIDIHEISLFLRKNKGFKFTYKK